MRGPSENWQAEEPEEPEGGATYLIATHLIWAPSSRPWSSHCVPLSRCWLHSFMLLTKTRRLIRRNLALSLRVLPYLERLSRFGWLVRSPVFQQGWGVSIKVWCVHLLKHIGGAESQPEPIKLRPLKSPSMNKNCSWWFISLKTNLVPHKLHPFYALHQWCFLSSSFFPLVLFLLKLHLECRIGSVWGTSSSL